MSACPSLAQVLCGRTCLHPPPSQQLHPLSLQGSEKHYWQERFGKHTGKGSTHSAFVHKLGNLSILSRSDNSRMSNREFDAKLVMMGSVVLTGEQCPSLVLMQVRLLACPAASNTAPRARALVHPSLTSECMLMLPSVPHCSEMQLDYRILEPVVARKSNSFGWSMGAIMYRHVWLLCRLARKWVEGFARLVG